LTGFQENEMTSESILVYVGGMVIIIIFSALAVRTQRIMWNKIHRRGNGLKEQREITMGKARAR
jgi:hypothetical protein